MLVPTRELALQTSAIVKEMGKHLGVQCMVSTGGTTLKDDIMRLYNVVHILVSRNHFPKAWLGIISFGFPAVLINSLVSIGWDPRSNFGPGQ